MKAFKYGGNWALQMPVLIMILSNLINLQKQLVHIRRPLALRDRDFIMV